VANDPEVKITVVPQLTPDGKVAPVVPVPPSPLLPEVTQAMEKVLKNVWPGVPLVATMSTGATDGKYTRIAGIPTYGISCMFFDITTIASMEKTSVSGVQDFYDGVDFNYRLMKELSSPRKEHAENQNVASKIGNGPEKKRSSPGRTIRNG